jgi:hypothetical protein
MSRSDRALIVVVAIALAVGAAGYLKWRDRRFLEVAESIDPCDEEKVVLYKTGSLGAPALEERADDGRIVSWRRGGKLLSVLLVPAPSGPARPIAVSIRVEVERGRSAAGDAGPIVLYEDSSGLQRCK